MASASSILVVSPARDEEKTAEATIASMVAQTVRPVLWVIVNDGSSDGTAAILDAAAREHEWIRVVHRADRGYRQVGGGVVEAFDAGLATVDVEHEFIGKLDMDLSFAPTYFERILGEFAGDPKLAAASGKMFVRRDGELVEEFMIDEMVLGGFLLYRRAVFDEIGGFVPQVMWDGIAMHRSRIAGYRTCSLHDRELAIEELRPMGASEGSVYRGRLRWGYGQWFMGSAFPYVVASGLFRMRERPRVIGGLLIIAGYCWAALRRRPRYDDAPFRAGLRGWQYERLRGLFSGRGPR